MPTELSVVLPSFNGSALAEQNLPLFIEYLEQLNLTYEIILVDDGSPDSENLSKVADRFNCRFVRLSTNRGKGAAVREGMRVARGAFRLYTDIDVPYAMDAIELILLHLKERKFHIVVGDRRLPESDYAKCGLVRRLVSSVVSQFVGRFIVGGWLDTQCGLKGFRDHVAEDLFSVARINRFAFDIELLYIALKRGYDIKRIPVHLRMNNKSVISPLKDGLIFLTDLFRIRMAYFRGFYEPVKEVVRIIRS